MKKWRILFGFVWILASYELCGQGIAFTEGDFDAALQKANQENKLLFIDFYTVWCGPCKTMSKEVFIDRKLGEYFNEKFVSIQLDAERMENRKAVKKFKIKAYPTLVFVSPEGKAIVQATGALDVKGLLKMGQVAAGDALSFEELYEKFKNSRGDLGLMQQVLQEAPGYVTTLEEEMTRERWIARVEKLFREYIDKKIGPALINAEDYRIINTFHQPKGEQDRIMEFINSHIEEYLKLGKGPAYYVMEYNNGVLERLARAGDEKYKNYLKRIDGDMKLAYSVTESKNLSPLKRYAYIYDGEYALFYKKDADTYVKLMDAYFKALGTEVRGVEYGTASQKIYAALDGNVPQHIHRKAIEWNVNALQDKKLPIMEKVNLMTMLGDSHKALKEYEQAKKCYNQAYLEAMQIGAESNRMMIQMLVKRKIEELNLVK